MGEKGHVKGGRVKYQGFTASIETDDNLQWASGMPPQQWTRDLPTEPGWYAYANDGNDWWDCVAVEPAWNSPSLLRDHGIKEGDLIVDTGESIKSVATFADWWLKIELPPVPKEVKG